MIGHEPSFVWSYIYKVMHLYIYKYGTELK